jgi:hypothetical protein
MKEAFKHLTIFYMKIIHTVGPKLWVPLHWKCKQQSTEFPAVMMVFQSAKRAFDGMRRTNFQLQGLVIIFTYGQTRLKPKRKSLELICFFNFFTRFHIFIFFIFTSCECFHWHVFILFIIMFSFYLLFAFGYHICLWIKFVIDILLLSKSKHLC